MWFRVDDKLHDHRKSRAAGAAAMGVWLLAGSWSADNLTDGFIPATVLGRWGRPREAKRLVEVGLWHADEQDGEVGWRFHEWTEHQPSRAETLAKREIRAIAGRSGGLASGRSRREAKPKQVASTTVEPPTRPDPTVVTEVTTEGPRKRASRLPEDWNPTPEDLTWASERCPGVNHLRETEKFRNYWAAKAGKDAAKLDWSKTWRNWLLRASESLPARRTPVRVPGQPIYVGD